MNLPVFSDAHLRTNSSDQCWKTCPRKYFLSYRLGIRPPPGDALRIGSAWHLGCEVVCEPVEPTVREALSGKLYEELEYETTVAMVLGWHERWKDDAIIEIVHREIPFDVPIINPATGAESRTYRNAGKIDAIGRLPDGSLCLIERKTCGQDIQPGSDYWLKLLMDSQLSRYVLAARELGFAVDKIVYDVCRKPSIRPRNISKAERAAANAAGHYCGHSISEPCPEHETPRLYAARLRQDMRERPDNYFARKELVRLDADLREFQAEQWAVARSIREAELDEARWGIAAWPRNTGACIAFSRCEYLDVCRGLTEDPQQEIPAGFVRVARCHQELEPATTGDNGNGILTTNDSAQPPTA